MISNYLETRWKVTIIKILDHDFVILDQNDLTYPWLQPHKDSSKYWRSCALT